MVGYARLCVRFQTRLGRFIHKAVSRLDQMVDCKKRASNTTRCARLYSARHGPSSTILSLPRPPSSPSFALYPPAHQVRPLPQPIPFLFSTRPSIHLRLHIKHSQRRLYVPRTHSIPVQDDYSYCSVCTMRTRRLHPRHLNNDWR